MTRRACFAVLVCLVVSLEVAQGQADTRYRFENERPAYETGTGPVVCVDKGHEIS